MTKYYPIPTVEKSTMRLTHCSFSERLLHTAYVLRLILSSMMVNFMCTGYPDIWVNIIPGESVRVFPDEISIWINRLHKTDCLCQYGWFSSNLLSTWIEQKEKGEFALRGHLSFRFPLLLLQNWHHWLPGSQAVRLELKLYQWLSWASSLQAADHGTFQLP